MQAAILTFLEGLSMIGIPASASQTVLFPGLHCNYITADENVLIERRKPVRRHLLPCTITAVKGSKRDGTCR